ncbi:MAG: stage 0 sporulation protein [Firmicutes bacterium]|nr:stage 0 sporulation protein [Bacillota bacterium]
MPEVIGIKFKTSPKMYYYGAKGETFVKGDDVIVDSPRGIEVATVVMPNTQKDRKEIVGELKDIMRRATQEDLQAVEDNAVKAKEILPIIKETVSASGLDMHVSKVEIAHDSSKCIINFTSEGRVDFRDLVREIAGKVKMRIELRQIGARDECRSLGGLGPCGRACCCSDYIPEYPQTSIKMAKNQGLSLNPAKVSGLCGRLMCCLSYENEHYCDVNKRCPKIGGKCKTKCGAEGTLSQINHLKETIKVKVDNKDREGYEIKEFNIDDLQ